MTIRRDKAKRWWTRFSVRTLMVLVTLVCVYLACWRLTATVGVTDVIVHVYGYDIRTDGFDLDAWTPMPMVVRLEEQHSIGGPGSIVFMRRYYFWYFCGVRRVPLREQALPGPTIGLTVPLHRSRFEDIGSSAPSSGDAEPTAALAPRRLVAVSSTPGQNRRITSTP